MYQMQSGFENNLLLELSLAKLGLSPVLTVRDQSQNTGCAGLQLRKGDGTGHFVGFCVQSAENRVNILLTAGHDEIIPCFDTTSGIGQLFYVFCFSFDCGWCNGYGGAVCIFFSA